MKNVTLKEVAKYAGIPASTWKDFLNRKGIPSQKTVERIQSVVNFLVSQMIDAESLQRVETTVVTKPVETILATEPIEATAQSELTDVVMQTELDFDFEEEEEDYYAKNGVTGPLTKEQITRRMANVLEQEPSCPRCGSRIGYFSCSPRNNHFAGCTSYEKENGGCKWTVDLNDDWD